VNVNFVPNNSEFFPVTGGKASILDYAGSQMEWAGRSQAGSYCRRKMDLLRIFSDKTDQLSAAAVHHAKLAGNTTDLGALAKTRIEYEKEKAATQAAYLLYFHHCREHGC
jgi:hypothetical protein